MLAQSTLPHTSCLENLAYEKLLGGGLRERGEDLTDTRTQKLSGELVLVFSPVSK